MSVRGKTIFSMIVITILEKYIYFCPKSREISLRWALLPQPTIYIWANKFKASFRYL